MTELTPYLREIMFRMNKGYYLITIDDSEHLSVTGHSSSQSLKSGTIESLTSLGLVKVAPYNTNKFLLTDIGRTLK